MLKRSTLGLLVVALLLAGGLWLADTLQKQSGQRAADQNRLLTFASEAVAQIHIETPSANAAVDTQPQRIQLEKQPLSPTPATTSNPATPTSPTPATWQITQPLTTPADGLVVDNLLRAATTLQPQATIREATDYAEFGLEPARDQLTFVLEDESRHTLKLGSPNFDGSSLYAQAEQGSVVTIPVSQRTALLPSLFALRDKRVVTLNASEIGSIHLQSTDKDRPSLKLLNSPSSGWQIVEPRPLNTDTTVINQFLGRLTNLQATEFVAESQENLASFDLARPQTQLIISRKDSTPPITLAISGKKEEKVYAFSSQIEGVVTLDPEIAEGLRPDLAAWRDPHLVSLVPSQIGEIQIEAADDSLRRSLMPSTSTPATSSSPSPAELTWELSDQPGRAVVLTSLFTTLQEAKATEFLPASDRQANRLLEKPELTLTLMPQAGLATEPVRISLAQEGFDLYARSSTQTDILKLDVGVMESVLSSLRSLRPLPSPTASPS